MLQFHRVAHTVVAAVVSTSLAAATAEPTNATWVVDRDRAQCANADFTSIQAAVDAAQPGDLIRVCPDRYSESVVIDKPLTLKGDPEAVEALDCFEPTLPELSTEQQAIVDSASDGFSIALRLAADNVVVEGLVIEGASVGIDAGDRFSGFRIAHNLLRLNTLFGIDLGSDGTARSRVDHNCLRENGTGVASQLDDDAAASNRGPENARDLRNARLDHNATFRNGAGCCGVGLDASGPGQRDRVVFDHNIVRDEIVGIALQNATLSAIVQNEISSSRAFGIFIGGANDWLEIRANAVHGTVTATGIRLAPAEFVDKFPVPSRNVLVSENEVTRALAGIYARPASLLFSVIADNVTSGNGGNGINMYSSHNVIRNNRANNNGVAGITAWLDTTGNLFEDNSMHGNGSVPGASFGPADARDRDAYETGEFHNVWTGNDCDTDIPAGMICGVG